jgi:adenosylcobinamide-GDP ribazoletransferase
MRDSRIGSYGVIALVLALGLAATGLADLPTEKAAAALLLAATGSRLAMLVVLDRLPPAREDGLGRSASGAAPGAWLPGALTVALLAVWIGPAALTALAAMALAAVVVARLALRRIGGQTGDVLGATQVTTEVACIVALSAAL